MNDSDEGVAGLGTGSAASENSEWVPRPLILQPQRKANIFSLPQDDETNEIPALASEPEISSLVDDDPDDAGDTTDDPDGATDDQDDVSDDQDDITDAAGVPEVDGFGDETEELNTEEIARAIHRGGTDPHAVIGSELVLAPSQELVSLRPVAATKNRRPKAFWLRLGAAALAVIVVGFAAVVGLQRGLIGGGEALSPTSAPSVDPTSSETSEPIEQPPAEDQAPLDEGALEEVEPSTEESIDISKDLAKAAPRGGATAPSPGTTTGQVDPPPAAPDPPAQPAAPKPTVVTSGAVVLTQYSDRTGTYWQYAVSGVPLGGTVQASTSDGRVDNLSRPPFGSITVKTKVPVSDERVTWTVVVQNRQGVKLNSETLTTG